MHHTLTGAIDLPAQEGGRLWSVAKFGAYTDAGSSSECHCTFTGKPIVRVDAAPNVPIVNHTPARPFRQVVSVSSEPGW